ncbi:MAG: dihydrofolate reductase family protein, partial [Chloroflexota bacterium]|nr:dihydrofolate reductase family protein [Chloroflexota bacterium]
MASTSLRVDRLWPEPALGLELEVAFGSLRLPPSPARRPMVGLNMVTSLDGRAQIRGSTTGLSTRTDRQLMRWLRIPYDAVASGAGTLRDSGLWPGVPPELADMRARRGRPPQPTEVLVAGARPVPLDAAWFDHQAARILIVGVTSPHAGPDAPPLPEGTELLVAPTDRPRPDWILTALAARGMGSVLLEGGPTLNASFLAADALDEVYLTI